jgi:hypothetical protein
MLADGDSDQISYLYFMGPTLDLLEETLSHFNEGARSVRAYTNDTTYIITKMATGDGYYVAQEEPGFPKTKVPVLDQYFNEVFGIEAIY